MDTTKLHQAVVMVTLLACQLAHADHSRGFCDGFLLTGNTSLMVAKPETELNIIKAEGLDCETANLPTIDIIRCHGYPAKAYEVTTEDGYILTMHRIEHGKSNAGDDFWRPIVFLQHDFLGSSADWVIQHHSKSLGFILADSGYDVWMGNFRGNTYSRKHSNPNLSPTHKDYWDFTIDEMAHYDLPAMMTAVMEETTEGDLMFVGHGVGTTAFMAMSHYRPDLYQKVRLANLMSPMAYISNMKSPMRWLTTTEGILEVFYNLFGDGELLPSDNIVDCLASLFCINPQTVGLCTEIVFIFSGFDSEQLNTTLMDAFMHHSPAGTSSKTLLHLLQLVKSGGFHGYDWGSRQANEAHHGSREVPTYHLYDVESPVAVYYGDNDYLSDIKDVDMTISELPFIVSSPHIMIHEVDYTNWNHIDFVWGMDAKTYVYEDLLDNLEWCAHAQC